VDSTGAPLGNGVLVLSPPDTSAIGPGFLGGRSNVRADGSFTLTNVAPGAYTLTVSSGRGGGGGEVAQVPLTVASEDLAGLYISTTRGATLSGSVMAAAGNTGALPLTSLQITTQSPGVAFGPGARPARVESSGAFELTGLIGERFVRVNGVPAAWTVQSMVLNGVDIIDTPVAFRPNDELRGLRVLLTDRVTEVTGKVATGDGALSRDYTVVLFPEDESRWTPPSRFVRSGRPDQDGLFKIRGLPPDSRYLAVAVNYLEEGEGADPEFLDRMRTIATRFGLGEGETRALDLTLVER
jgi:hypothetical protein